MEVAEQNTDDCKHPIQIWKLQRHEKDDKKYVDPQKITHKTPIGKAIKTKGEEKKEGKMK